MNGRIKKIRNIAIAVVCGCLVFEPGMRAQQAASERMSPLPAADVLQQLNLDAPGLEEVKSVYRQGDRQGALQKLLDYYRSRQSVIFETELPRVVPPAAIRQADDV